MHVDKQIRLYFHRTPYRDVLTHTWTRKYVTCTSSWLPGSFSLCATNPVVTTATFLYCNTSAPEEARPAGRARNHVRVRALLVLCTEYSI